MFGGRWRAAAEMVKLFALVFSFAFMAAVVWWGIRRSRTASSTSAHREPRVPHVAVPRGAALSFAAWASRCCSRSTARCRRCAGVPCSWRSARRGRDALMAIVGIVLSRCCSCGADRHRAQLRRRGVHHGRPAARDDRHLPAVLQLHRALLADRDSAVHLRRLPHGEDRPDQAALRLRRFARRPPAGGFGVATVLACVLFGAISGSSVAMAAAMSVIAIPK